MPTEHTDIGGMILPSKSIERARKVLEFRGELTGLNKTDVNFLKGLPAMIMQNGLGQTVAFLKVKSKDSILCVLCKLLDIEIGDPITAILRLDVQEYCKKQREAIECAAWMKEFGLAFRPPAEKTE
ncbi:MAG: type III-B CRISPR module-associated protein Cmr5 [Candidatus Eisenbacteria bacterium]|nr:type III-B CRISPR module-associated protein Cmr5 [Candidatus Eisenbacteria bacterium]